MRQPTPKDGAPQDEGRKAITRSMDAYLTLRAAIPHATADKVAYEMGNLHGSTVRKWCCEPETDEEMSTGRRSPLDRICDLIEAVHKVNPQGADLILDHIRGHLANLKAEKKGQAPTAREWEEKLQQAQILISEIYDDLRAQRREKLQAVK